MKNMSVAIVLTLLASPSCRPSSADKSEVPKYSSDFLQGAPHSEPLANSLQSANYGDTIRLPDGRFFQPGYFRVRVLGQVQSPENVKFFVISGFECEQCDANRSILVRAVSSGSRRGDDHAG